MRHPFLPAAALLLGLAGGAAAAPGIATAPVEMRAGPGLEYPPVALVSPGIPLEIIGCLQGYAWCDVGAGPSRGWLPAGYLQFLQAGRAVPLPDYAPRLGVPVIGFRLGDYWGDHYRDRPWYAERERWRGPPPPRADFRGPPPPDWRRDGPDWRPDGRREERPDWRPEGRPEWRHDGRADWRDERRNDHRGPPPGPAGEGRRGPGEGRGPDHRGPDHRGHDDRGPR